MENIFLSIIIPVYNTNLVYFKDCINSLKYLSKYCEVIIINDGSTNQELNKFCDNLSKKNNFKYIYKTNNGVSSARNVGLKYMSGKYFMFLDSDDLLVENFDKIILDELKNDKYDLLYFSSSILKGTKIINSHKKSESDGVIWAKVYKKSIVSNNNLLFLENLSYCEDSIFLKEFESNCNMKKSVDKKIYIYRINENSLVHQYNPEIVDKVNQALIHIRQNENFKEDYYYIGTWLFLFRILTLYLYNKKNKVKLKEKKKITIATLTDENYFFRECIENFDINKHGKFLKLTVILIRKKQFYLAFKLIKIFKRDL